MKSLLHTAALGLALCSAGIGQAPSSTKSEFDAAAINPSAAQTGHFRPPAGSRGGPGTADPTLFRCTNCDLAFLITKAFELQRYQFPGQGSLPDAAFDVSARVPEGATPQQFAEMLQNLLKDRFGLAYHYDQKQVQGYDLVVAKNGPNLKESTDAAKLPGADAHRDRPQPGAVNWHGSGGDGGHAHATPGLMVFGGRGRYSGDHLTTAELARMIATQLARPVDDRTGLQGKYDITLTWSDDGSHAPGYISSAGDHATHGGDARSSTGNTDGETGPTLPVALQAQLGLKLEAKRVPASIFVVDHVDKTPTAK